MSETDWIELRPGIPWTTATDLNRIARQQGLCLAMAQASVSDEICSFSIETMCAAKGNSSTPYFFLPAS